MELTQAGTQFLPYARQAVESLNKGVLELSAPNRRQQGGIRVGVSPLIAGTVPPDVIREFQQCTGRSCEIVDAELEVLHDMVETRRLDAAYGTYMQRASRLKSEFIFDMALQLACPGAMMPEGGAQDLQRQQVFHIATVVSFISAGMGMGFVPAFM